MAALAAALAVLAGGCARVPELAATIKDDLRDSHYPRLRPVDVLVTPAPPAEDEAARLAATLEWRRRALERQARALRAAPVLDEDERRRMEEAAGGGAAGRAAAAGG